MGSWLDEVIGSALVGVPVIGPVIAAIENTKAVDDLAQSSSSAAAHPGAVQLKPDPIVISSSPSAPMSVSGGQGLEADEAALLKDYNTVMAQLERNRVSVSRVHVETQAAFTAIQDLQQEIANECAAMKSATSYADLAKLQASIQNQLTEMQIILQQQNDLAQAQAEKANELARQCYVGRCYGKRHGNRVCG